MGGCSMSQSPGSSGGEAPVTVPDFLAAPSQKRRLAVVSLYDYPMARMFDEAGADCLLVGDSLGMVVRGEPDSLGVTLEEMIYHAKAVVRGTKRALVVVDMPFMSYQLSPTQALENAGRILRETGAHAVKLEGGLRMAPMIEAIVGADIPVMGHIGLTPQSVHRMGGHKVQGRVDGVEPGGRQRLLDDAHAVEQAGAFAVVLEGIPTELAQEITSKISIPTIGIGAGSFCDGQVLVMHDILGLSERELTFTKKYVDMRSLATNAFQEFAQDVRNGSWPDDKHSFH